MAILNTGSESTGTLYIAKLKIKWFDQPTLVLLKKNEDWKYVETWVKTSALSWDLKSISIATREYEWEEFKTVKVLLVDQKDDEAYIIDAWLNWVTRWMINSLLSLENWKDVAISFWSKNWFWNSSIKQWWNQVSWKFHPQEDEWKSKIELIKNKKWEVINRDYSELDEMLEKEVVAFTEKLWLSKEEDKSEPVAKDDELWNVLSDTMKDVDDKNAKDAQDLPFN